MAATNQFSEHGERSGRTNPRWIAVKSAAALGALSRASARFRKAFAVFLHSTQVARMNSVLTSFSDVQLEQVGITRAEIPSYAARLISDDGVRTNDAP